MPELRIASQSVLGAIGNTPAVWLERLTSGLPGRILLKLELLNPGGSVKDRPALQCILDGEKSGSLLPGMPIVELTSGNMGIGLAVASAVMGYRMIAVMSEGNSPERRHLLQAYGAEIALVPQTPGGTRGKVSGDDLALVEIRTVELVEELGAWRPNQFANPSNPRAHELGTGPELWRQAEGSLDAFVAIVGTGGTFVGTSRALKSRSDSIRCLAVEPQGAQVLGGQQVVDPAHKLQGAGYALIPPHWDESLCDGTIAIRDEDAVQSARDLARREGIVAGYSTGANVAAALRVAASSPPGFTVATIACDTGTRYLSGDLFDRDSH
jgi:cysteine synthase A